MAREIMLPIAIELPENKFLHGLRRDAAVNEEQVDNLQRRLDSGTIMRFGEEYLLTTRQRGRREQQRMYLSLLVQEDVSFIRRSLARRTPKK